VKSLLSNCINTPVRVASTAIFGDERPRVCRLIGLEDVGVWLASDELSKLVYEDAAFATDAVFVPLAQIIYLVPGATPPARALDATSPPQALSTTRSQHPPSKKRRPTVRRGR
jgi:hypothetical protein